MSTMYLGKNWKCRRHYCCLLKVVRYITNYIKLK